MLLACMKKNDFEDSACRIEHTAFNSCMAKEKKARADYAFAAKEGKLGVGEMNYLNLKLLIKIKNSFNRRKARDVSSASESFNERMAATIGANPKA